VSTGGGQQTTATQCSPGTFSTTGNVPCTTASAGFFASGTGATSQSACPGGATSPAGSTSSSQCSLYAFTSHTFTNCGATGKSGPTLASCQSGYAAQSWAQNTTFFNQ
jgi:hypothetical protein